MGEFTNIQWTFHKEFVWFLYKISIAFCLTIKSPRAIWWKILYLSIMIAACSGSQQGHQLPKTWNVAASWPPECQYSMSGWCFDTIDSCVCVLCVCRQLLTGSLLDDNDLDVSLFDDVIHLYQLLLQNMLDGVKSYVFDDVRARSRPYRTEKCVQRACFLYSAGLYFYRFTMGLAGFFKYLLSENLHILL